MSHQIIDCDQYSEEWWAARNGLVTTSNFKHVLAKGKGIVRTKYMRQLAGERITGGPAEKYSNKYMERGLEMEAEAIAMYEFQKNVETQAVGFVRNDMAGSSPDRFIGEDGMLEIKTAFPHILIEALERKDDAFPPEHMAQCQGQLWVCDREWLDLCIYWPGMPLGVWRLKQDKTYIYDLKSEVKLFNRELAKTVERIEARR